jgi:dephospho-CoA kinase
MKIVGLTGGIGTGKTTVAKLFNKFGVPVFYADSEAKDLYNDPEVVSEVAKLLNAPEIINPDGTLKKESLARIIFNDAEKRNALNQFIHPLVKNKFDEWLNQNPASYCIREAAILIESGAYKDCNEIIVVTSPMETRIHRVMKRDQLNRTDVEKRILAQLSDEERIKYASFIIHNNGTEEDLSEQVKLIHSKLTQ